MEIKLPQETLAIRLGPRNTYIAQEHYVIVLPTNYISILCMKLCVNDRSYT